MWRSSIGRKRSASAGLPVSMTTSRISPLLPVRQIELVAVLNLTTALDDDVGVRLEQADQFLARRHRLAIEHAALGLGDEARDQRQIMVDLSTPALDGRLGALRQPGGDCLQFGLAGLGSGDQLAIELALLVPPAAVFDGTCPLLGQAPTVAPPDRRRPG
jgi:hypothetical protein